jgi:hypothetical protein
LLFRAFRVIKPGLILLDPGVWELQETASYHVLLDGERSSSERPGFLIE